MNNNHERPEETPIVHIKDVKAGFGGGHLARPSASWWLKVGGGFIFGASSLSLILYVLYEPFFVQVVNFGWLWIPVLAFGPTSGFILMLSPWVVEGFRANPDREGKHTLIRGAAVAASGLLLMLLSWVLFLIGLRWG